MAGRAQIPTKNSALIAMIADEACGDPYKHQHGPIQPNYNKPVPAILEIPSKDHPYDPAHDSVLSRVRYLFSAESVASGRR
ncbi:hypothetical protein C4D60_Mb01t20360 [Musa balbisiana]|uniref:Uncharacterized protein n=1 Tax=Musa balbisiana TaxID=52838 RepID=A0A4V4H7H3_MUSBA|nr:hypothetical protein C4D60_Mb01t20360 [Musa balbisiana]